MKLLLACVLALAAPAAARAESVIYVLDSEHSFVHFEVLHFGTSTVRGRFGPLNGLVELDREAGRGSVFLRIPMASLDTGIPAFNARLRQPDLLASEVYPTAEFASANFVFDGRTLTAVNGELTLRGTRQGVELRALRFGCHTHPVLHREVCGGDFEGQLKRGDFGASFGMPFVENRVRLRVQVEGIRQ
jgi:polyisoprenoid-binding protein YceI